MKKIDLVMWTLNSEKYLALTLESIHREIPDKFVNRRIIIDGGSADNTENIVNNYNWEFYKCKKGIPYQANMALEMVDTPVFASFEHDIILCKNWFFKIKDTIKSKNVAVSQGIRLCMNKPLRAIEKYAMLKDYVTYTSIDNNLYKTKIIRDLGGYSLKHPASVDRELQDRVRFNGYKWLINENIVSDHLVFSVVDYAKKAHKRRLLDDYHEDIANIMFVGKVKVKNYKRVYLFDFITKVYLSFIVGLDIARKYNCLSVSWVYPYWRLYKLKTLLELLSKK